MATDLTNRVSKVVGYYYWRGMSGRVRLTAQFVREHLPPQLRVFKWLSAPQKR
jgi:hypothetical protein